ncbi:MAG: hypothetical protein IJA69_04575 [Clostridia bacterium]|nr:hypothetical protein [Clostridia bacterium]
MEQTINLKQLWESLDSETECDAPRSWEDSYDDTWDDDCCCCVGGFAK